MRKTLLSAAIAAAALVVTAAPASADLKQNGISINGLQLNGIIINGLQLNGIIINGLRSNGFVINGVSRNSLRLPLVQVTATRPVEPIAVAPRIGSVRLADGTVVALR